MTRDEALKIARIVVHVSEWASDGCDCNLCTRVATAILKTDTDARAEYETLHPIEEWHEDIGCALWWHVPVQEPPYVGSGPGAGECDIHGQPTTCADLIEKGWLTHWSKIPPRPEIRARGEHS